MNERFVRAAAMARVDLAHEPDFLLGAIEVRPARREIATAGHWDTLEPRVMRVLVALVRAKGDTVSRDDLIASCWDGIIVGEDAINRCISRLRKAADAAGGAFSIETLNRVGYRLQSVELDPAAPDAKANASLPSSLATPAAPMLPASRPRTSWVVIIAAALVLTLAAVGTGLWFSRQGPTPDPVDTSVAVLPFLNMSGDPAKEYFSDGFSEELLNDLSNNPHLRVAARSSSFAFRGKNEDVESVARVLRVHSIVEGSVRESGNRIRITAQLIDAGNGYDIWSATYDRNLADILSVQDEVGHAIAAALTHKLIRAPDRTRGRINPTAYRQYLEARQLYSRFGHDNFTKAIALLKLVTASQPDFADGFAALATATMADYDLVHGGADVATVAQAVQKALSLDPKNIEARITRGLMEQIAMDWSAATSDFRKLQAENPNNVRVLRGLRIFYNFMGFPEESIAVMRRARLLDPSSDGPMLLSLQALEEADHYDELIRLSREILSRHPDHQWAVTALCDAYARTGRLADAQRAAKQLRRRFPTPTDCDLEIAAVSGDQAVGRKILASWIADYPDKSSAVDIAQAYVELNDFDKASDWYERAYERNEEELFPDAYWIDAAKYHETARWKALTQKVRFKAWQTEHDRIAADLSHGSL